MIHSMNKKTESSAVINGLLRFIVGGGVVATIIVAPGMAKVLDKPTRAYFRKLDKAKQERELTRLLYYMKRKGLIALRSEDYVHGVVVTDKAKQRLKAADFDRLSINPSRKWDKKWRVVFFDIPEQERDTRRQLTGKLKQLEFQQLQRSVWIHPFSCREEIEIVSAHFKVQKYITYIETTYIDSQEALIKRFSHLL